jgi:catechol 2,3-dioxygenase-like lactoylglutathione lyase family enzyme
MPPPTAISHVLETCIYVKSMSKSQQFYSDLLGLKPDRATDRITIYPLGQTTLLLFQLGLTSEDIVSEKDSNLIIPKHGPTDDVMAALRSGNSELRQHFCLAVKDRADAEKWEEYLRGKGVPVSGRMKWPRGGYSVYFHDPDGRVGEIASQGIWAHY